MTKPFKSGKVILAGAGPGDPELITMKAVRYLQNADVVLIDRLVSSEIVKEFVNPLAEIIHVGKQCRRGISTSQQTINELMVEHALLGRLVVRLKGGDVSIFSNILDELETLAAQDIPYEIIPGVTAALGAAAFAGIPLTARGYATSVRFLTNYKSDIITDKYWEELAATSDTLVFYMSSETLPHVVKKLTENNIDDRKLLAIIEQATTPLQNVHIGNLYDFEKQFHEKFKWLENSGSNEYYFKPMVSPVIALNHSDKIHKNVS
jgi:uroporphyrin-III C-methyltransferase